MRQKIFNRRWVEKEKLIWASSLTHSKEQIITELQTKSNNSIQKLEQLS